MSRTEQYESINDKPRCNVCGSLDHNKEWIRIDHNGRDLFYCPKNKCRKRAQILMASKLKG